MSPTRMLLVGPLRGSDGGATILFRQLVAELRQRPDVDATIIDTTCGRQPRFHTLGRMFSVSLQLLCHLWRNEVISLHLSWLRGIWFAAFFGLCRISGRPWSVRIFGDAATKHRQLQPWGRWWIDAILRQCPLLLVETHASEEYFRVRCQRVEWYPNNRPFLQGSLAERAPGATRFVFVGQVRPDKGIREMIAAARIMPESCSVSVYGPLQGISPEEFAGNVRYYGEASSHALPQILSNNDALLLPTYYPGEGYPGVILEAFAAGVPVIATRWQSIPEIVGSENGLLVEPRDVFELAAAMRYLSDFPEELQRMRVGAIKTAAQFDSAVWADRFAMLMAEQTSRATSLGSLGPSWLGSHSD